MTDSTRLAESTIIAEHLRKYAKGLTQNGYKGSPRAMIAGADRIMVLVEELRRALERAERAEAYRDNAAYAIKELTKERDAAMAELAAIKKFRKAHDDCVAEVAQERDAARQDLELVQSEAERATWELEEARAEAERWQKRAIELNGQLRDKEAEADALRAALTKIVEWRGLEPDELDDADARKMQEMASMALMAPPHPSQAHCEDCRGHEHTPDCDKYHTNKGTPLAGADVRPTQSFRSPMHLQPCEKFVWGNATPWCRNCGWRDDKHKGTPLAGAESGVTAGGSGSSSTVKSGAPTGKPASGSCPEPGCGRTFEHAHNGVNWKPAAVAPSPPKECEGHEHLSYAGEGMGTSGWKDSWKIVTVHCPACPSRGD